MVNNNSNKVYVIYNKKSEYYFTKNRSFAPLGYETQLYKDYYSAYKDLEIANANQCWELLEAMHNGTDRWHLDVTMDEYNNVEEHVELLIKAVRLERCPL